MSDHATTTSAATPQHIAIIMDGNGRWAQQRGLGRSAGHRAGADAVVRSIENCQKFGVKYLTLYAFSTENWKRSPSEIAALMQLLGEFLDKQSPMLDKYRIRLKIIGEMERLPAPVRKKLQEAIAKSAHYDAGVLTIAVVTRGIAVGHGPFGLAAGISTRLGSGHGRRSFTAARISATASGIGTPLFCSPLR